jgi:hypothetical protein
MAPEQAGTTAESEPAVAVSREVGPATDVYALGAILYELLTGRPPFRGSTPMNTVLQLLTCEAVPPRLLVPKVPRDLETICLKCLQKDPHRRYASAADLTDDVRRFQVGQSVRARPVGPLARLARWGQRNPAVAGLLAAVAAVLLAGALAATYFGVQADRAARSARGALLEKEAASRRERETARRFVGFIKRNPDLVGLPLEDLVAKFVAANTDLSWDDVEAAFVPEAGQGFMDSPQMQMLGD